MVEENDRMTEQSNAPDPTPTSPETGKGIEKAATPTPRPQPPVSEEKPQPPPNPNVPVQKSIESTELGSPAQPTPPEPQSNEQSTSE